jgi:hypothetical protein
MKAFVFAEAPERQGSQRDQWYLYDVKLNGELIVAGSKDPETDLARALLRQHISGIVTLCDGVTGKPRTIVNIDRAAKLRFRDDVRQGPIRQKWHPYGRETLAVPALTAETQAA